MEEKRTLSGWITDHFEEILLTGMFVTGLTAGVVLGYGFGWRNCEKCVKRGIERLCDGDIDIPGVEITRF